MVTASKREKLGVTPARAEDLYLLGVPMGMLVRLGARCTPTSEGLREFVAQQLQSAGFLKRSSSLIAHREVLQAAAGLHARVGGKAAILKLSA
jgi:hypothetical protein